MGKPKKPTVQINVFTPDYYRQLYDQMLQEMRESPTYSLPKWKKDVLILLLMKSREPCPTNKKALRKEVDRDIGKIVEEWI